MGLDLTFRVLGAVALAIAGIYVGGAEDLIDVGVSELYRQIAGGVIGFLLGLAVTPYVTIRPILWVTDRARRIPAHELVAVTLGLLIGLVISALVAIPLSMLPGIFGRVLPFIACIILSYLGMAIVGFRRDDLLAFLHARRAPSEEAAGPEAAGVLLDTSAIIDGRIAEISQAGFVPGALLVPRFVLDEVQHIADSSDALRRNRGRRALEVLNRLRREPGVVIRIHEAQLDGNAPVDARLVDLARKLRCPIVTNDYNLNRVAVLQGVRVLNVNELANAVKSVYLPGEEMVLKVIQEGKEPGQGVGYLDDGTMVVVENGRRHISSEIEVVVSRVFQTAAGRMIFGHPKE